MKFMREIKKVFCKNKLPEEYPKQVLNTEVIHKGIAGEFIDEVAK